MDQLDINKLSTSSADHAEHCGDVGSCGLRTLHNAFKTGFSMWQVDKLLEAMHTLFLNVPVRREDYITVTKSTVFPLSFCGHRRLEKLPTVERALVVWPSLLLYMDAVKRKELPNPGTASFDRIEAAQKDPLILPKLHLQSPFEEVPDRRASDAFPWQRLHRIDQGND